MAQHQVYQLLKKKNKWMTAKEIAKSLKAQEGSVRTSLNKMVKYKEVSCLEKTIPDYYQDHRLIKHYKTIKEGDK